MKKIRQIWDVWRLTNIALQRLNCRKFYVDALSFSIWINCKKNTFTLQLILLFHHEWLTISNGFGYKKLLHLSLQRWVHVILTTTIIMLLREFSMCTTSDYPCFGRSGSRNLHPRIIFLGFCSHLTTTMCFCHFFLSSCISEDIKIPCDDLKISCL